MARCGVVRTETSSPKVALVGRLGAALRGIRPTERKRAELGFGAVTLVMGVLALILAETFAADVLFAVFMGLIIGTWTAAMILYFGSDHTKRFTHLTR